MKKIIDGKKYDTETAKLKGSYSSGVNRTSFSFYKEELYQKKTGEWFLYGSGGATSKYSECGDGYSWGTDEIIRYSEADAKKWAERYMSGDEYIECFGEVEE